MTKANSKRYDNFHLFVSIFTPNGECWTKLVNKKKLKIHALFYISCYYMKLKKIIAIKIIVFIEINKIINLIKTKFCCLHYKHLKIIFNLL